MKEEVELGSWAALGALELGGGGVLAYEKAQLGWFFKLRHSAVVTTGFLVAIRCSGSWQITTAVSVAITTAVSVAMRSRRGETSQQLPPRRTEETGPQ
ncbi:hypothetical protein Taro_046493 [Colocasia esculenta]|uniref:Uncharacterized protein n=1 Tax=Colocasia esculenta TaxID=4460 RepID=A0A843X7F9_COLES|nr:hypothetical protein [Colocasia esculenta]